MADFTEEGGAATDDDPCWADEGRKARRNRTAAMVLSMMGWFVAES